MGIWRQIVYESKYTTPTIYLPLITIYDPNENKANLNKLEICKLLIKVQFVFDWKIFAKNFQ